jgi:hypothetical protein
MNDNPLTDQPSLPDDDGTMPELRIRLTKAELELLGRVAGENTATWARLVLLREARTYQ